jgi:membrane protein implicated in regulation of membrane protease activity
VADDGEVRPFLARLAITAAILLLFGIVMPAIFGVEPFSYLRLSVFVLAATVLLLRWLRREERPYDQLQKADEQQEANARSPAS